MSRPHKPLAVAAAIALTTTLASCGDGGSSDKAEKTDIVIALATEPNTLDGQRSSDGNARIVIQNITDELVKRDPEGELIPGLAESLPELVSDKTWKVKLRDGVTFHNGEKLSAELVVANLERAIDPKVATENADIVGTIAKASALDELTVEITTKVADPILPSRLAAIPMMAAEVLEGDAANRTLIGSGPYKLAEWDQGSSIKLETYEDYWGEEPAISSVKFRFVPDPGSQEAGLNAGEIDLITNLSPDSFDSVPQVFSGKSGESPAMTLNADAGVTKDVRVRRALNLAIDQEVLAESLFGGKATPQKCQMSNEGLDHHNESLESYDTDLAEAKELIKEAGAEGKTIDVVGESGRWLRDREVTEAVAEAWSEIGLKPNVQILEFSNYLDVLFDRNERPDSIYSQAGNPMLAVQSTLDAYYSAEGSQGSNSDKKLAGMVDTASRTLDDDKRYELIDDVLKRGCDEALFAFLPSPENLYGGSESLVWTPESDASVRVARMSWE